MEKLAAKLKAKMHEHAQGIAGYQFLAGCNIFRREVPHRKGDRISAADFRRVVEYKFGMKLDPDEVSELLHFLVPGTGESIEIAEMVRLLMEPHCIVQFKKLSAFDLYLIQISVTRCLLSLRMALSLYGTDDVTSRVI